MYALAIMRLGERQQQVFAQETHRAAAAQDATEPTDDPYVPLLPGVVSSATYDIRRARFEVLIVERNWRAAYDCAAELH